MYIQIKLREQICWKQFFAYTHNNSDGSVGVLYSAVYVATQQVYRHQDVLQKVGVALCMPNARALCNSIPT